MAYDAFISYSHAADGRLAPALQRAMQRLAKPWYRPRALRVFRDESALSANPHLWSSIQTALDEAEWFVLLASPDAVASEWVNRELSYWLENQAPDRILVVLTDGSLEWDGTSLTGTAVPDALQHAFNDEPRHVDLGWAHGTDDLNLRNSRFRAAVADLAAPVHGLGKDDLESEDIRLHRRARRLARGGVTILALLLVVAVVSTTFAVLQRNNAAHSARVARSEANVATADRFATLSTTEPPASALGLLLAVEGYERNASATTTDALLRALVQMPQLLGVMPPAGATATTSAISPDGSVVAAGTATGDVAFWRPGTTTVSVARGPAELRGSAIVDMKYNARGTHLYTVSLNGDVEVWDVAARRPHGLPVRVVDVNHLQCSPSCGSSVAWLAVSPDEHYAAVAVSGAWDQINEWDLRAHRAVGAFGTGATAQDLTSTVAGIAYSPDSTTLVISEESAGLGRVNARTLTPIANATAAGASDISGTLAADRAGIGPGRFVDRALTGRLIISDARTGKTTFVSGVTANLDPAPRPVAMSGDGSYVADDDGKGEVVVTDATTGAREGPALPTGETLAISLADDGRLATTSTDGTTVVWQLTGAGALATAPSFVPRDRHISRSPGLSGRLSPGLLGNSSLADFLLALAPDGRRAAIMNDGNLVVVDTTTGRTVVDRTLATNPPSFATGFFGFEPSGRIVRDDPNESGGLTWYDPNNRSARPSSADANWVVDELENTPNAPRVLMRQTSTIAPVDTDAEMVVDLHDGARTVRLNLDPLKAAVERAHPAAAPRMFGYKVVYNSAVSRSGRYLATVTSFGDLTLWEANNGREIGPPLIPSAGAGIRDLGDLTAGVGRTAITALAFSPDDKELAVAHADGSIVRMAVPSLNPIGAPIRNVEGTVELAYQPGGDYLVASTGSSTATFIDLANSQAVATMPLLNARTQVGHIESAVQFSDSGHLLMTSGAADSHPALFWSMQPPDWLNAACRAAGQNLSRAEWSQFVGTAVPYHRTCPQWPAGS
jgi:WD40 repeat protein